MVVRPLYYIYIVLKAHGLSRLLIFNRSMLTEICLHVETTRPSNNGVYTSLNTCMKRACKLIFMRMSNNHIMQMRINMADLFIEYLRTRVSRQTISHTCVQSTFNNFAVHNVTDLYNSRTCVNRHISSCTCVLSTFHRVHALVDNYFSSSVVPDSQRAFD